MLNDEILKKLKNYYSLGVNIKIITSFKDDYENEIENNNRDAYYDYRDSRFNKIRNLYESYKKNLSIQNEEEIYHLEKEINRFVKRYNIDSLTLYIFKDTSEKEISNIIEVLDYIIEIYDKELVEEPHFKQLYQLFGKDESLKQNEEQVIKKRRTGNVKNPVPELTSISDYIKQHYYTFSEPRFDINDVIVNSSEKELVTENSTAKHYTSDDVSKSIF